ncbi:hypothetical protein KFK09_008747 [Dendrobium nobile]|uniref:Uncharacterized protein n=1 Tax=Dendrobium nobile TaxID=94219 RepID=A0A8T3BNW5_DENNO|nr:hypothetical protein KFK09_008747 [Dendrobium nobile]
MCNFCSDRNGKSLKEATSNSKGRGLRRRENGERESSRRELKPERLKASFPLIFSDARSCKGHGEKRHQTYERRAICFDEVRMSSGAMCVAQM